MKRLLAPAIVVAAALAAGGLALAARDSDESSDPSSVATSEASESTSPPGSGSAPTSSPPTVGLMDIEGLGAVLTDAEGKVLYIADEEADPEVLCTDACEEFWVPAEAGSEAPMGASGVTDLDIAERPDGTQQLTFEGRRLYTFSLDEPGQAGGEGFSDTFGDQRFTWHVAVVETTSTGSTAVTDSSTGAATATEDASSATTATPRDVYDYP